MKLKVLSFVFGLSFLLAANLLADTVKLKNGREIQGTIIKETESSIKIKTPKGTLILGKGVIQSIIRSNKKETDNKISEKETDSKIEYISAKDSRTLARHIISSSGVKGGLCVHIGCGDGKLSAELFLNGKFLVHGIALDRSSMEVSRQYIKTRGIYGQVSVDHTPLKRLPYADNLVNLVVVDNLSKLMDHGLSLKEVMRVLCPNGIALLGRRDGRKGDALSEGNLKTILTEAGIKNFDVLKQGGLWARIEKPRPKEMDDWTHVGYDAANTRVSKDKALKMISDFRWIMGPYWDAGYVWRAVSSGGRFFYWICDDMLNFNRTKGEAKDKTTFLVARDAYNGSRLWVHPVSASAAKRRNLVAVGDRVYTALGKGVVALDGATGNTVMTYEMGSAPFKLLVHKDNLIVFDRRSTRVFDLQTGKLRWENAFKYSKGNVSIVAADDRIFGRTEDTMVCFNLRTGEEKWRSKPKSSSSRLIYGGNALASVFTTMKPRTAHLNVYSAKTGEFLWSTSTKGMRVYGIEREDVFFIHNLFWFRRKEPAENDVFAVGFDPLTGNVRKRLRIGRAISGGCYHSVALEDYFISTRTFRFVSTKDGKVLGPFFGGRHACKIGIVPANGLIYSFAQHCDKCAPAALRGTIAFAPATEPDKTDETRRLFKGPAFGKVESIPRPALPTPRSDWSTFRHDAQRSSGTEADVPADFELLWRVVVDDSSPPDALLKTDWIGNPLGGDLLTQPTVADGMVFVSLVESHRVVALDAQTGETRWSFTAGGRLDTPPTIHEGLCLFGCADGRVYCLRAADGRLAWWYRAAPRERRILAYGQLESKWPVVGGVLMENGVAYCAAGRTSAMAGSETMDFFRSGTIGFYDYESDSGVRNFGGVRPSCGAGRNGSMIPALGLLIVNEGSSGCGCGYNFQCSLALVPADTSKNEDWAVFSEEIGIGTLLRHVAINLGAPGDRRDDNGIVWLGFPRPKGKMGGKALSLGIPLCLDIFTGFGAYRLNSDRTVLKGTNRPWIYASGYRGFRGAVLNLSNFNYILALCPPCAQSPKIDGSLSDPCWDGTGGMAIVRPYPKRYFESTVPNSLSTTPGSEKR